MNQSLTLAYRPVDILKWHFQTSEMSCAASGMEMILKAHDLLPLEDFTLQKKYGDQNIGFEKREELESRGLTVSIDSLFIPDLLTLVQNEIDQGRFPLISLPVHQEGRTLWFHVHIVEPDGDLIRIIDPASAQSRSGTKDELAAALGYHLRGLGLPLEFRLDVLTYTKVEKIQQAPA